MRLAHYFGTSAAVWMRLQARYDLEVAESDKGARIREQVRPLASSRQALVAAAHVG